MTKRQITITECDRCGTEDQKNFGILKFLGDPSSPVFDQWDLCLGCASALKRWMQRNDY